MSDKQLLQEIFEIVRNPDLKATAIRNRIANLLLDAGFWDDETDEEDDRDRE